MANNDNENDAAQVYLLGKTYLANNQGQFYIKNDPIVHMAAGDRHTIIITETGRAFAFGDNTSGQLGLGHMNPVEKVSCIKSLKATETGDKVVLAACGRESSIVATNNGTIYGFGSNNRYQLAFETTENEGNQPQPTKIEGFRGKNTWKQISMGAEHACALTDDGLVFVWGANDEGQCGQLKKFDVIKQPKELRMEHEVVAISCGYYHTALVTGDGELYLMGSNDDRQLGCTISDKFSGPIKVSIPDKVVSVACGYQHTVVLTDKGDVYACGFGNRGQLGLGSRVVSAESFELIPNLPKRVTAVAAGEAHTAVLGARKELYLFGDGKHGKLGANTQSNEFDASLVEKFKSYHVLKVVCGGCQTIVLAQKKSSETRKASDSDEEMGQTLSGTQRPRSLARSMRAKNLTERSLNATDSMDSTLQPVRPLTKVNPKLRTESDSEKSDKELSESLRSATFNKTHTISNGKFLPTQSPSLNRTSLRGNDTIKTGAADRTVPLNREDSPKTPTRSSRFGRESPPSPRRKQQDSDGSPPSPRKKRESPPSPRRQLKRSDDEKSSSDERTKSFQKKPLPPARTERKLSPINSRLRKESDDEDIHSKKGPTLTREQLNRKPVPRKKSEDEEEDDDDDDRTTKGPPPPPARRSSLPPQQRPEPSKSTPRDGSQTIGSKPVDGVRGSFRTNATKSLAKPTTSTSESKPSPPAEPPGFFRRLFGSKSATPPPPPPPPAPAPTTNASSKACSVM